MYIETQNNIWPPVSSINFCLQYYNKCLICLLRQRMNQVQQRAKDLRLDCHRLMEEKHTQAGKLLRYVMCRGHGRERVVLCI